MPTILEVRLGDRNPAVTVGRLAERDRRVFFEYDPAFLRLGLDLSPLGLPLRPGIHEEESKIFRGLHGVFDDSLPDGWGLRLTDRAFAARGIEPSSVTPLERLQFVGTRGMGALTFHPFAPTSTTFP